MTDEKMIRAQQTYKTMCDELDAHEWRYTKDNEALTIICKAQGDDLPMEIKIIIDGDRQLITLISHLPFVIPKEKRLDAAIATAVTNYSIIDGSFDFDIKTGDMYFRMTNSFIDTEVGGDVFKYLLPISFITIDKYNDQFFMLGKGVMTIEQFIENNQ